MREVGGQLVLDDPDALAFIRAIEKHSCATTLQLHVERVAHFKRRAAELGRSPLDAVIVIANVDDEKGAILADALMPGTDWQAIRDRGETPFARGLATREGIQEFLDAADKDAADKLRQASELVVVVVDRGVAEIFLA